MTRRGVNTYSINSPNRDIRMYYLYYSTPHKIGKERSQYSLIPFYPGIMSKMSEEEIITWHERMLKELNYAKTLGAYND